MRTVLAEIKEIEENGDWSIEHVGIRYTELQGKLFYLLGKGIFEKKLQAKLKAEIKKM